MEKYIYVSIKLFSLFFLIFFYSFNKFYQARYNNEIDYLYRIRILKQNYTVLKYESKYKIFKNDSDLKLPHTMNFTLMKKIKNKNNPNIIIAVLSSPHNFKKRFSFRILSKDYCNCKNNCKFIFFCGYSKFQNHELLNLESHLYNDIVQFSFQNSYLNLTILSVMAMKYCFIEFKIFDYFIKTDDDMMINYPLFYSVIRKINKNNSSIYGHFSKRFKINRNRNSGSYIPYSQYPYEFCPQYVYGGFIIITYVAIIKIHFETQKKRNYIWKEDVNLGIICKESNVSVLQLPGVDIMLRNRKCVKNNKTIATETFNLVDTFFCI